MHRAKRPAIPIRDSTRRMPLPPPPATAFSTTGKPIFLAASERIGGFVDGIERAGDGGDAGFARECRAAVLEPNRSMASADGPINVTRASAQARANEAFSERKP